MRTHYQQIESLFRRDDSELEARSPLPIGKPVTPAVKPVTEEPTTAAPGKSSSLGTDLASSAVGGAVSATVSNVLNKIESLFSRDFDEDGDFAKRDVSALSDILNAVPSLSSTDKQTVKTALMNKISTLQAPASGNSRRGFVSSGLTSAAGGLTSVASNTVVGDLLSKIESLFRRYDVPEQGKMRRGEVLGKLAGMQRRSPLSLSKPSGSSSSSSGGTGTALLGGAVGGAASGFVGNILSEIESLFRREENLDTLLARSELFE